METRAIVARLAPSVEFHQDRYARAIREHLVLGNRWLDLGAGTRLHDGAEAGPLSPQALRGDAPLLVGVDVMCHHLRRNASLTCAVCADIGHLPFKSSSFDLVTANMVLEHLAVPSTVLAEVGRVLRPGGCFVGVTPNAHHPVIWLAALLLSARHRRHLANTVEGRPLEHVFPTFYHANTARKLRELAGHEHLDIVEISTFASIPFSQHPLVLVALECLLIRACSHVALSEFRSNLLVVLQRTASPSAPT